MNFQLHTIKTSPEKSKSIIEKTRASHGFIPNLYRVMAESPETLNLYEFFHGMMHQFTLSQQEQLVVLFTITTSHDCNYCTSMQSMVAEMMRFPKEEIEKIKLSKTLGNDKLETLRRFTQLLINNEGWVTENERESFIKSGFSNQAILEIISILSIKTLSTYVNRIAQTPIDVEFGIK
ncbi:MAG: hypothetical protein QM478_10060 [Flavobacteriaceae bacterium]